MTVAGVSTIGFIGAGNIGGQLARLAVAQGYSVVLSNSRGPESLTGLVAELGGSARAGSVEDAAEAGDLVVVTIPLHAIDAVPAEPLAGKTVIDTNNYYPQRDGVIDELEEKTTTTAELLQSRLPGASVVKAFNHIGAADLTTDGSPAGTAGRRALVLAGDDDSAKATVAALTDEFGFDVVDAGPLAEGWRIERDTPGYGVPLDAVGFRSALAAAQR
ncbi:MAG: oxidoreductase [Naasia sp.]|nr:oxidoreductase [Naasia sp.]